MKRLSIIAGIVVAVLVLAIMLAPLFINVDSFRPELEQKMGAALNRPVQIGKLDASIWSGGASAENISIGDDPAFSKGPFLQASSLKVGLRLMPLIFSRQFSVTSITVEKPEIVLLHNAAGKWNYSSLGATSSPAPTTPANQSSAPAASSPSAASEFSVDKFEIADGKITIGQAGGRSGKNSVYQNVKLVTSNISLTSAMPFTLSAVTPGGGALKLEGQAGPLNRQDSARTPFQATLNVNHLDTTTTGLLDPGSGLAGTLDFDGKVSSDGRRVQSQGKATANGLKLVQGGTPAHEPVALDYNSDYSLDSQSANLQANVHTGKSTATASGTVDTRGEQSLAHLKLQGKDMQVDDLAKLLPAFGIVLPQGASLQGGVANLDMTAEGPLDRLVINGPANISGTHLTGYNLTSKLSALAAFTGVKSGNDTLIQTVSSALRVAPEGLRADNILLDVPSIGTLTGAGVIDSKNNLNFQMVMKLNSAAGSALGSLANISGGGQNNGIPFLIEGTTANPTFRPNLNIKNNLKNALMGDQKGGNQQGLGGILGGFLNKKDNKSK
jgi:AsmA protein